MTTVANFILYEVEREREERERERERERYRQTDRQTVRKLTNEKIERRGGRISEISIAFEISWRFKKN